MRSSAVVLFGCWLLVATAGAAAVSPPAGPMVGKMVGPGDRVEAFLGIPYARAPVGPLRWQAPQALEPWTEPRPCTEFGPCCPQPKTFLRPVEGAVSEDCLYLNVWRPVLSERYRQGRLPVMVWIHGGGFTIGGGSQPVYDGTVLARQGVILVTINYRLGPFGFLAHPALSKESPRGVSGNYGLLDQIAALKWVQRNIAAFGGDARRVTIFGESAGSVSVSCLLASPLAKGLFHRAIVQSGTADAVRTPLHSSKEDDDAKSMEQTGLAVAERLDVSGQRPEDAAALRSKTAEELLSAANPKVGMFGRGTKFWPCVDGYVLPEPPPELFAAGRYNDVPVMIGTTANEGTLFTKFQLFIKRPLGYRWLLKRAFGENAGEIEALYPAEPADDVPEQIERVVTAACFTAPARRMARSLAEHGRQPVYLYYFSRACPYLVEQGLGATHGSDIFYVFGTAPKRFSTEVDDRLATAMQGAWVRFATAGDPNGGGLPAWPPYSKAAERHLEWDETIRVGADLRRDECDLFDRVGVLPLQSASD
jgi:para-nitrobenzyl esterase